MEKIEKIIKAIGLVNAIKLCEDELPENFWNRFSFKQLIKLQKDLENVDFQIKIWDRLETLAKTFKHWEDIYMHVSVMNEIAIMNMEKTANTFEEWRLN